MTERAVTGPALIESSSVPDAGAFVARVLRLDPRALVRLRGGSLWAHLPFGVLVTRRLAAAAAIDATVRGAALLDALDGLRPGVPAVPGQVAAPLRTLPTRHDAGWLWTLPADAGRDVEELPVAVVLRVSAAAAATVRAAESGGLNGRAVGSRILRDALLDHVPIVVDAADGSQVAVSQRLIQGLTRMDFVPRTAAVRGDGDGDGDGTVVVRVTGGWVGLAGAYGTAWYRPAGGPMALRPLL